MSTMSPDSLRGRFLSSIAIDLVDFGLLRHFLLRRASCFRNTTRHSTTYSGLSDFFGQLTSTHPTLRVHFAPVRLLIFSKCCTVIVTPFPGKFVCPGDRMTGPIITLCFSSQSSIQITSLPFGVQNMSSNSDSPPSPELLAVPDTAQCSRDTSRTVFRDDLPPRFQSSTQAVPQFVCNASLCGQGSGKVSDQQTAT